MSKFRWLIICLISMVLTESVMGASTVGNTFVIDYSKTVSEDNKYLINVLGQMTLKNSGISVYAVVVNLDTDADIGKLKEQLGLYSDKDTAVVMVYTVNDSRLEIYTSKRIEGKISDEQLIEISNDFKELQKANNDGTAIAVTYERFCKVVDNIRKKTMLVLGLIGVLFATALVGVTILTNRLRKS